MEAGSKTRRAADRPTNQPSNQPRPQGEPVPGLGNQPGGGGKNKHTPLPWHLCTFYKVSGPLSVIPMGSHVTLCYHLKEDRIGITESGPESMWEGVFALFKGEVAGDGSKMLLV